MWRLLQISAWCTAACALVILCAYHHKSTKIPKTLPSHTTHAPASSLSLRRDLQQEQQQQEVITEDQEPQRGYKILSLGGSVTWGAHLPHRAVSYPYQLTEVNNNVITNAAIRATGSEYPSLCIESMIGDKQFNLILLEFSINGYDYLELLLKRLRFRFPDAVIIYVHLYSLQTDIVDGEGHTPFQTKSRNATVDYSWGGGAIQSDAKSKEILKVMHRYNGHVYTLTRHDDVADSFFMFGDDWHHLSTKGHKVVAKGVWKLLQKVSPDGPVPEPRFPQWHVGDQCSSWFMTGKLSHHYTGPVKIVQFEGFGSMHKFALEFKGPGYLYVHNHLSKDVPLYIFFMTKDNAYPTVNIRIGETTDDAPSFVVNTKSDWPRHVMRTQRVGFTKPGRNQIFIQPTSEWKLPFRLTAIAQCEACLHFDTEMFDKIEATI